MELLQNGLQPNYGATLFVSIDFNESTRSKRAIWLWEIAQRRYHADLVVVHGMWRYLCKWSEMLLMFQKFHWIVGVKLTIISYLEHVGCGGGGEVEGLGLVLLRVVLGHVAVDHDGFRCTLFSDQQHRLAWNVENIRENPTYNTLSCVHIERKR